MKKKEINKIYFGIGIEDDFSRIGYCRIFFYWFKLKQKNPVGEMLKRGRDYIGFNLSKEIRIPTFSFEV